MNSFDPKPTAFSQYPWQTPVAPTRRKIFISYYHGDQVQVDQFLNIYKNAFIHRAVGALRQDNQIDSSNPDYTMRAIRQNYIQDSTVTIVLIGSCTHSRRYVDWEIKASLQQGSDYLPNGLLGIQLPGLPNGVHLPPRLQENWNRSEIGCHAIFRAWPSSDEELRRWIEDAYARRSATKNQIANANDTMFGFNRTCKIHNVVH